MNERIKELLSQAGVHYEVMPANTIYEKFAELIIQDIGQIVTGLIVPETWEQDIGPYEHWNRALGTIALEIEQHFYGDAHDAT